MAARRGRTWGSRPRALTPPLPALAAARLRTGSGARAPLPGGAGRGCRGNAFA
ncbi:hypothetical protein P7K49_032830, partial [Saguinus oedipus]